MKIYITFFFFLIFVVGSIYGQTNNETPTIHYYGMACGLSGAPPPKCMEMFELVNKNDSEKIVSWLYDMNPEIAAYGYTGLIFLEEKGILIKESEQKQMKLMMKLPIEISTCGGCYYGWEKNIKEVLNKRYIKRWFKWLSNSGWLDRV